MSVVNWSYSYNDRRPIRKIVSNEELDDPIVNFLNKHNMQRACWMIDDMIVDVKNNFRYYAYKPLKFIGSFHHVPDCNIKNCDLITFCVTDPQHKYIYKARFSEYKFKFIDYNNPIYFGDTFKIFRTIDKNNVLKTYPIKHHADKNNVKTRSCDVDLYCVVVKCYQNLLKEIDSMVVMTDVLIILINHQLISIK